MSADKILVADQDAAAVGDIEEYLTDCGYSVITAGKSHDAAKLLKSESPSLAVIELPLTEHNGRSVMPSGINSVPFIVISEHKDIDDKLSAFEAGADDYLTKPFDMRELGARIKAVLRRTSRSAPDNGRTVSRGNMEINMTNYELKINGRAVSLPPKELELLYYFASNPDRVFSREQLLDRVWGFDYFGDLRTVDVHVKRLRTKIEKTSLWNIVTVWGVGYKFALPEETDSTKETEKRGDICE